MGREHKGKSLVLCPNSYIVLDLETTGFNAGFDDIIEISALKISNGIIVDTKKANCYLLDQPLAVYTVRKGSLSRVSICSLLKSHFLLFRIQEGFPWAVAWLFAVRNGVLATFKKCLFKKRLSR